MQKNFEVETENKNSTTVNSILPKRTFQELEESTIMHTYSTSFVANAIIKVLDAKKREFLSTLMYQINVYHTLFLFCKYQ